MEASLQLRGFLVDMCKACLVVFVVVYWPFPCEVFELEHSFVLRSFVICQRRLLGKEFFGVRWAAFVTFVEMVVGL